MDNAMWLARIFGPYLAILGFWMLIYGDNMNKVCSSIKNTPGIFYLNALINLLVGIAILSEYNMWRWQPAVLVTLLGWAMLVKGFLALFLPQALMKWCMTRESTIKCCGILPFIWGLALCWFAFLR